MKGSILFFENLRNYLRTNSMFNACVLKFDIQIENWNLKVADDVATCNR